MKTLLAATALILSVTAAANAADTTASTVLAGGPIFAQTEANLYCEFINFGSTGITPTAQQIFELTSTTAIATTSSCANGSAVSPNETCYIFPTGTLGAAQTYACKLTFSTAATHVRGTFQLYDSSFNVLSTVELR